MVLRSPHLHQALRCFCLAAFKELGAELELGATLDFDFEEHAGPGRPRLYEYRPLVGDHVEARAERLSQLEDARIAVAELAREPAAAIFGKERTIFGALVMPLLVAVADACGGFDWDETAFAKAYAELESRLYGSGHRYVAVAPLVGLSTPVALDLGGGIRVRQRVESELEGKPECVYVIELQRELLPGEVEPPDAPGELADAVTALRLATGAPVAAGPVVFETIDRRPFGTRPAQPYSGLEPPGEPSRLDRFRGGLARDLFERLALAGEDADLSEAIDRWELSLFEGEPSRSEHLRVALAALLGRSDGLFAASVRLAVLVGENGEERADLFARLRGGEPESELVRRALVEVLMHGDRERLIARLDESLLGLTPAPPSYYAVRAVAG